MESIVARQEIRELARAAADRCDELCECNPYPPGSSASMHFEHDYWSAVNELEAEALV